MPESITKILFRKGNDIQRRTGGGLGVVLAEGEPGFCLDTGRLYVGAADQRIGGRPVGMVNHLPLTGDLFDPTNTHTYGYKQAVYHTLTSAGVDTGDLIFSTVSSTLFRVTKNHPFSAVPAPADLYRYPLFGQLRFGNGLSGLKIEEGSQGPVVAYFELDKTIFGVADDLFVVKIPASFSQRVTIGGDLTVKGNCILGDGNQTVTVKSTLSAMDSISAGGGFYARSGGGGDKSIDWFNAWTYVNTQSAAIEDANTKFIALTPLAWYSPVTAAGFSYTQQRNADGDTVLSQNCKYGINFKNTDVVGLVVQGIPGNSSATALSVIGGIDATGDITAFKTSDERLKTNIKPIENALDIIQQIDGVEFDWNCDHKFGPDVGVLAQQIEKVFPRVVTERADGYKAVSYEKLIALLIQGIKELVKRK